MIKFIPIYTAIYLILTINLDAGKSKSPWEVIEKLPADSFDDQKHEAE